MKRSVITLSLISIFILAACNEDSQEVEESPEPVEDTVFNIDEIGEFRTIDDFSLRDETLHLGPFVYNLNSVQTKTGIVDSEDFIQINDSSEEYSYIEIDVTVQNDSDEKAYFAFSESEIQFRTDGRYRGIDDRIEHSFKDEFEPHETQDIKLIYPSDTAPYDVEGLTLKVDDPTDEQGLPLSSGLGMYIYADELK